MMLVAGKNHQLSARLVKQLDTLAHLPTADLRKHWIRLYKAQPPKRISRDLLLLAVGWKIQARALGGLSVATKRKLICAAVEQSAASLASVIRLKPGTRLVREWHGEPHEVLVLENGFEWRNQPYRSLSQVAREITGAHWSGLRFFGLKPKPDNFASPEGHCDEA